jgi:hypothetical protein
MMGKRNDRLYAGYSFRPITADDLWSQAAKSIRGRIRGFDIDAAPDFLKEELSDHLRAFYLIHDYDVIETLSAAQRFVAAYILDNRREYWQYADDALDVMARYQAEG